MGIYLSFDLIDRRLKTTEYFWDESLRNNNIKFRWSVSVGCNGIIFARVLLRDQEDTQVSDL